MENENGWPEEADIELLKRYRRGELCREIAVAMKRSHEAVRTRLFRLRRSGVKIASRHHKRTADYYESLNAAIQSNNR